MSRSRRSSFLFAMTGIGIGLAVMVSAASAASDAAAVQIDSGKLKGVEANGVISFKGIPFAAPPVGNLRWRNPQPVQPWDGVLDASAFGLSCMQADDLPKSEDCLTLNVWRPAAASDAPLAVMVWIYGGAFAHGNTPQYPGDALAAQGVIIVSMNYRMGRLGFFAHPALLEEAPDEPIGNYGFMDQLAALKWVQRNIAAFGGDPKKVTIFGESAGGGSVQAHMISPLSRGLFSGAILQSPAPPARAAVIPVPPLDEAERRAITYARSVGINTDGAAALAALRSIPAERLVDDASAADVLAGMGTGVQIVGISGPILDGRFLTETTEAAFAAGHQAMVPVIVGANNRDIAIGVAATKTELFALAKGEASEARALYDPDDGETLAELKQQLSADMVIVEPSRHLADEMARAGQPVWWYRFSYVAEALREDPKWTGTLHGYEIPYTFDIPATVVRDKVTDADKAMAALASAYWVSFGKTGNPNGGDRANWPVHDPAVDQMINFTNDGAAVVGPDPLKARLDLWKRVWETGN